MIEPIFEKINYSVKNGVVTEQIKAESKTDIPSDAVKSILSVSAWSVINEYELSGGKIAYNGKIIFCVSYLDKDGAIKKAECGNECGQTR